MRKRVFGHMRTAKPQISLRIRAVWSGFLLSANRIIGYYRVYDENKASDDDFAHAQDDLNLRIFSMFEGTFSLITAHIIELPW